jgi:hypothetical protein
MTTKNLDNCVHVLDRFVKAAREIAWSADENNQKGFQDDVGVAFETTADFANLRILQHAPVSVFEVEWRGTGSCPYDLQCDFFRVLARFAEPALFVEYELESEAMVFHVITGATTGTSRHGHLAQIRMLGRSVRELIERVMTHRREMEKQCRIVEPD